MYLEKLNAFKNPELLAFPFVFNPPPFLKKENKKQLTVGILRDWERAV